MYTANLLRYQETEDPQTSLVVDAHMDDANARVFTFSVENDDGAFAEITMSEAQARRIGRLLLANTRKANFPAVTA